MKTEHIENILREEVACLICSGEYCVCDGTHDSEKRKELAIKIAEAVIN